MFFNISLVLCLQWQIYEPYSKVLSRWREEQKKVVNKNSSHFQFRPQKNKSTRKEPERIKVHVVIDVYLFHTQLKEMTALSYLFCRMKYWKIKVLFRNQQTKKEFSVLQYRINNVVSLPPHDFKKKSNTEFICQCWSSCLNNYCLEIKKHNTEIDKKLFIFKHNWNRKI